MKIQLAENIRQLRKARGMMQEQLAEALGVSVGAVSKWERGAAVPDLAYILELADLFGVSLDALLGYEMQNNAASATEARIHQLQRSKRFDEAALEAEKALLRYPNDFRIVQRCGTIYQLKGIETKDPRSLERAIELLERAVLLLSQNTDPQVSETTLRTEIAECLLDLNRTDEGIALLKQHNTGGIHDALIGFTQSTSENWDAEDALVYLTRAYGASMQSMVQIMCGFSNVFSRQKDYAQAIDAMLWLIHYLQSLKQEPSGPSYVDRLLAPFYAGCAWMSEELGRRSDMERFLRLAYDMAARFDRAPVYGLENLRFCGQTEIPATAYDNLGSTAMDAVEKALTECGSCEAVWALWRELRQVPVSPTEAVIP